MRRAALFALTGLGFFTFWLIADPGFEASPTQGEWPNVLAFSAIILTLAFAVPQFADLVGGRWAFRASRVVAAGAVLSSVANVIEDGFKMDWAFFAFILGFAIMEIGLLALTIAIATRVGQRHYGVVPAGALAAILLFVIAGGPVMLGSWFVAAALALAQTRKRVEVAPTAS